MEPSVFKSSINLIVLLIIVQRSVAKFIDLNSEPLEIAKHFYDKRMDYFGEMDTNYITDDDYIESSMKTRRLSKRTNISITGGPTVLSVGDSAILKCSSLGSPAPLTYWVRQRDLNRFKEMLQNNPKITNNLISTTDNIGLTESKFIIDCASKRDEGEIFCISIIDEEILTASVNITVNSSGTAGYRKYCDELRRPIIVDNLKFLLAKQGGTVSLPCSVRKSSKTTIEWTTRDGQQVLDRSSYSLSRNGELVIRDLNWSDKNEYVCHAISDKEQDEAKTFLYPLANEREE